MGSNQIVVQQMKLLIDALHIASCALDREGLICCVNASMATLFGYRKDELLGLPIGLLVPPELRANHNSLCKSYRNAPLPRPMATGFDIDGMTKEGSRLPLDVALSPVETASGPLIVVTIHDLREARRTQEERDMFQMELAQELDDMRRLHELATRMVGSDALPSMLDDILSTVVALQHADFGTIQLYAAETHVLSIAAHKGFLPSFLEYFANVEAESESACGRALRTGERVIIADIEQDPGYAPHRLITTEAGCRSLQSTPILARDGQPKGVLSTYFIKPHIPSDRELRLSDLCLRMAAELIERAQAESALRSARLAAEQANALKTEFLSAAGYDLRQPLQTIGLLKAVLERQVINPHAFATLVKLDDAVSQMQYLVDALLETSLIESGAMQVEPETVRVESLLTRLVNNFMPAAATKSLDLRFVSSSAFVRGDRRLLTRILDSLFSNALKYTDSGKILIGCRRRDQTIRLEIWATGTGIPPESFDVIYDKHHKAGSEGMERAGINLGLYIAKRFAEQLGYKIEARSKKGEGSMFALIIPNPLCAGLSELDASELTKKREDPRILVVEGDPAQRDALNALLQLEGYQTVTAQDGAEALVKLRNLPTDVPLIILTDYGFYHGMTGLDIVDQARRLLRHRIPAFILSSREVDLTEQGPAARDVQFILKPVIPSRLLALVENAVRLVHPSWRAQPSAKLKVAMPNIASADSEVAVINDAEGVCDAERTVLEEAGYRVASFSSAEAYLADPNRERFKCLLVDIVLPGMSGPELQAHLNESSVHPQIIFLTGNTDLPLAVKAMHDGAADFLHKPVQSAVLLQSVKNALHSRREADIDQARRTDFAERMKRLTNREREILRRIVNGELNKNIAVDLGISERTTEHHRQNLMRKLEVKSLAMLVRMMSDTEIGNW